MRLNGCFVTCVGVVVMTIVDGDDDNLDVEGSIVTVDVVSVVDGVKYCTGSCAELVDGFLDVF